MQDLVKLMMHGKLPPHPCFTFRSKKCISFAASEFSGTSISPIGEHDRRKKAVAILFVDCVMLKYCWNAPIYLLHIASLQVHLHKQLMYNIGIPKWWAITMRNNVNKRLGKWILFRSQWAWKNGYTRHLSRTRFESITSVLVWKNPFIIVVSCPVCWDANKLTRIKH